MTRHAFIYARWAFKFQVSSTRGRYITKHLPRGVRALFFWQHGNIVGHLCHLRPHHSIIHGVHHPWGFCCARRRDSFRFAAQPAHQAASLVKTAACRQCHNGQHCCAYVLLVCCHSGGARASSCHPAPPQCRSPRLRPLHCYCACSLPVRRLSSIGSCWPDDLPLYVNVSWPFCGGQQNGDSRT